MTNSETGRAQYAAVLAEAQRVADLATVAYRAVYDPSRPRSAFDAAKVATVVYAEHGTTREHVAALLRAESLRSTSPLQKRLARNEAARRKRAGDKKGSA